MHHESRAREQCGKRVAALEAGKDNGIIVRRHGMKLTDIRIRKRATTNNRELDVFHDIWLTLLRRLPCGDKGMCSLMRNQTRDHRNVMERFQSEWGQEQWLG